MSVALADIDRLSPTRRPSGRVAGYQHWRELLFLHWRVSPAEIAARVPESLSVDTCEGSAWIGLVLFRMSGVRPWWSPPFLGVSAFPETNVRTYVHFQGRDPGVWFLSLDAASTLGVQIGRQRWGLPYHRSQMAVRRRGDFIQYTCEREWPGRMGVGGTVEAEIGDVYSGLDRNLEAGPCRSRLARAFPDRAVCALCPEERPDIDRSGAPLALSTARGAVANVRTILARRCRPERRTDRPTISCLARAWRPKFFRCARPS